jgi:hypothetical protein
MEYRQLFVFIEHSFQQNKTARTAQIESKNLHIESTEEAATFSSRSMLILYRYCVELYIMSSIDTPIVVNDAGATTTSTAHTSSSTAFLLLQSFTELSNTAIYNGTQQDIKPSIAVEVDLAYNLRRWLEQKPVEESFTAIRHTQ